jgi:Flp pilus assembly protein TadG
MQPEGATGWARRLGRILRQCWTCEAGTQLVEFAVTLPIIAVLLIGIISFGRSFNIKQEINNAAREGARFAANEPTSDLTTSTPASVTAVRDVITNYLKNTHVNVCGVDTAAPTKNTGFSWTYSANTGCPANFVITIQRDFVKTATIGSTSTKIVMTRVTLQYPLAWSFDKVIHLVAPGANYPSIGLISSDATMENLFGL